MAYGVKYRLDYCNSDSDPLRLDIEVNGYTGTIYKIETTGNPFSLSSINDHQFPKLETVRPTEASIEVFSDDNFNLQSLLTSDETHIRISHYMLGVLNWRGFALPEFFRTSIDNERIVSITATDRLGVLKNIPMPNNYLDIPLIDVIRTSLSNTGNNLNIKTVVGYQESASSTASRPFDTIVSGERLFKQGKDSLSCFDALKSTLDTFNCFIAQYSGAWWIINKEQLETGVGSVVEYGANVGSGVVSEVPFSRDSNNFDYVFTGGEESIRPVLAEVGILGELGGSKIYPENNNFRNWSGVNAVSWDKKSTSFNYQRYDNNVWVYNPDGSILVSTPGDIPKLMHFNNVNLDPFGITTGRMSSFAYLESNPIPIILDNVVDNKVNVEYDFNITSKNGSFVCFCVILETSRTDNKYFLLNGSTGSFIKAGNDKSRIFGESIQTFNDLRQGKYGAIVSDVANTELGSNEPITMSVKGSASVLAVDAIDFTQCKLYVRIMGTVNLLQYSNAIRTIVNSVSIDIKSSKVQPKGNLYKIINSGGTYTAKTDLQTAIFSDYIAKGLNGYFYNYPTDDTSVIRPIAETKWKTINDSDQLPVLQHSVRQIAKLYGDTQNELYVTIEKSQISPLDLFILSCRSESYTVSKYSINYLTSTVSLVLSQVKRPLSIGKEYIYSYFGEEGGTNVSGLGSVSGGSGGGGGARQDLQTTTEIGNTTTLPIKARGFRPTHFQGIPKVSPLAEDMEVGEWYMHVNPTAPAGETPTPGSDFYIKTANDANLSGIADGQLVSWSSVQGKFVPASFPSLTGYATQAWVNSQGFATQSWVSGQGFITGESDTLQSVLNRGNSSTTGFTINGEGALSTYISSAIENVAVGFKYKWYNDEWIVGNKRGGGDNSLGFAFKYNGSEKALLDNSGVLYLNSGNSTQWNTAYAHSQTQGNPHNTQFSQLLNKPTTLAGYGITDGVTSSQFNALTISGVNTYSNLDTSLHPYLVNDVNKNTSNAPNGFEVTGEATSTGGLRLSNVIKSNGFWTVSGYVRGTQFFNASFQIDICDGASSPSIYVGTNNEWVYFEYTYNVTNYTSSGYNFVDFGGFSYAYFYFKDIKVEKSTKATGYTPAQNEVLSLGIANTATNNRFSHYTNWLSQGAGTGVMLNSGASRMELFTQQNSGGFYFRGGTASAWGSVGRVWSSLDWNVDVNASANSVMQRNSGGNVYANHYNMTGGLDDVGVFSMASVDSNGWIRRNSKTAVQSFLDVNNGATLSNNITGNSATATALQTSRTFWGQSFNGTGNVSGNMTGVGSIDASGRITAPVIKAATLIIPTTAPTGLNAGEWGIYISPTI